MIGLARDQKILGIFKACNRLGCGVLYLLSSGISFELPGKGTVLELGYDEIIHAKKAENNSFSISWIESKLHHWSDFTSKDSENIVEKITEYKNGNIPS